MYAYYIDYAIESERDKEREGVRGGQILRMGGGAIYKGKEHTGVGVPTAILGVAEHLRRIKLIHNSALTTK